MDDGAHATEPTRTPGFQKLMRYRVREVLLVASRYDSFILEQEGQITDLILREYDRLNLRYAPRLNSTQSAREALRLLGSDLRFDMVIVTMHPAEMDPADFAREVKRLYPHLPVILLGYDNRELEELRKSADADAFDRVFIWTGDSGILLAMVSLIEDERNVDRDTSKVGVEVIILIEDSVHFISAFLPLLYEELMKQSQRLISEGITMTHKVHRMRARPKVLLASTFEEALAHYRKYRPHLLGVISDVRFMRDGHHDPQAGVEFGRMVRKDDPGLPVLLQSTDATNASRAEAIGVGFLHKTSPQIKHELETFLTESFGFGPFVFRVPDGTPRGTQIAVADNLAEFRRCLQWIPAESFRHHTRNNHFSVWLKARTEFRLAAKLRPRQEADFESLEAMRQSVIDALDAARREAYHDAIPEFSPDTFGSLSTFARIGGGSIGGKARGLAFLRMLLHENSIDGKYPGIRVAVPPMVVIATKVFDRFMEANRLTGIARSDASDAEIRDAFLAAELPGALVSLLRSLLEIMRYPFAVRSSSLLEDSQHQPFAGVYETYMLANASDDAEVRLRDLGTAVKLVYASTFSHRARTYLAATPQRPEKEKMAVIIQKLIGRPHNGRFYPSFSGVAQSHNYYPFGRITPEDGASRVALGLGRLVVEGRGGLRFCPRYPEHLPQLSSVDDILRNAQKNFDALPLESDETDPHLRFQPTTLPVAAAHEDRTLGPVGSVYSRDNHAIYDGVARPGTPVITFAGILKQRLFPLPEILQDIVGLGTRAMSTPVEIEFAVDMDTPEDEFREFACLQMRPLSVIRDLSRLDLTEIDPSRLLCRSPRALGHGRTRDIQDVVCIVPEEFDRRESVQTAAAVATLNAALRDAERPYLLIGPGRWGSADPWLGIPVNWGQISGVRIIIETGFRGAVVAPSEGSHFFHNMTAFGVAYLTVNPDRGEGMIDWAWLLDQEVVRAEANGLRWIRLPEPVLGLIDGKTGTGIIAKSAQDPRTGTRRPDPVLPDPTNIAPAGPC